MPFTETKDRRKMDRLLNLQMEIGALQKDIKPGDLCFVQYRRMIREWNKNPRWTTVDNIAAGLFPNDEMRAAFLAFMVFFAFKALPYEREKQRENGDITE